MTKTKKRVPSFWWDLEGEDEVIVESDDDRFPVVARFKYDPAGGVEPDGETKLLMRELLGSEKKVGCAEAAIEAAEAYIEDLRAGRANPRKCYEPDTVFAVTE